MSDKAMLDAGARLSVEMTTFIDKFVRDTSLPDERDRWAAVEYALARQMACILSSTPASRELKMMLMANWVQLVFEMTRTIETEIAAHKKAKAEGRMN